MSNASVISNECLEYDLTPRTLDIRLRHEDGTVKDYLLREANGEAVERRRDAILENMRFSREGRPQSMTKVASTESVLVSHCLFLKSQDKDGNDKLVPVSPATIRSWPGRIQKALFDQVKAMSELDLEDDTEEGILLQIDELQEKLERIRENRPKNLLTDTTDGSGLPAITE